MTLKVLSKHPDLRHLLQGSFCSSQDLQQVVQTLLLGRANACDVQWHEALKGAARTACEKADREQPASSELLQEAADATALVHRFETRVGAFKLR